MSFGCVSLREFGLSRKQVSFTRLRSQQGERYSIQGCRSSCRRYVAGTPWLSLLLGRCRTLSDTPCCAVRLACCCCPACCFSFLPALLLACRLTAVAMSADTVNSYRLDRGAAEGVAEAVRADQRLVRDDRHAPLSLQTLQTHNRWPGARDLRLLRLLPVAGCGWARTAHLRPTLAAGLPSPGNNRTPSPCCTGCLCCVVLDGR